MADIYPSYLAAKAGPYDYFPRTDATQRIPTGVPAPQPFNLQMQPPPPLPSLPPLNISAAGGRTQSAAPRAAAPVSPAAASDLPRGIPSNAIPVIRGGEFGATLSYDIPGTGQRLYPTLGGGVSEYSPVERLELARYTEPAQIGADAAVRGAGIRAGADVQQSRIAAEANRFNTLATLGATPRPFGSELVPDPVTGLGVAVPTYGVPRINQGTGAVEGFAPIGPGAARQQSAPREGATGTYQGQKVIYKNGKWVAQ